MGSQSATLCRNNQNMSSDHVKQSLITLVSLIVILGVTIIGLLCINSHCRVGCQNQRNKGIFYAGSAHRTKYGDPCINWKKHSGWTWTRARTYDHNHCRNPNSKEGVWCYTGLGSTWEYCDVPFCLEPGQDMNTTVVEKQAIPVIITATIILGTVSFFLVIVIFLIVGNWYCNRGEEKKDDTIELVQQSDSGIFSSQATDIDPL